MSNQFSYDLDERQIRILMQNAELKYDENSWQKFSASTTDEKKTNLSVSMPKINIGISRSVIVPIVFIVLIGGLSALLFSFIDFKKKEEVVKEIPLSKPAIIKKTIPPLPPTEKPKATPIIPKDSVAIPTIQTASVTALPKQNLEVIPTHTQQITTTKPTETSTVTTVILKKKKKVKQITEELPIINPTTTNLNENTKEPELEIK